MDWSCERERKKKKWKRNAFGSCNNNVQLLWLWFVNGQMGEWKIGYMLPAKPLSGFRHLFFFLFRIYFASRSKVSTLFNTIRFMTNHFIILLRNQCRSTRIIMNLVNFYTEIFFWWRVLSWVNLRRKNRSSFNCLVNLNRIWNYDFYCNKNFTFRKTNIWYMRLKEPSIIAKPMIIVRITLHNAPQMQRKVQQTIKNTQRAMFSSC